MSSFFANARLLLARLARRSAANRERAARIGVALAFLALFFALAALLRPVLQNGDSAVYNQQIESRSLRYRTTHVGYMALGILFNVLLPFGTDMNMNVMLLTVGVLGLGAVYCAAHLLSGSRWAAGLGVLLALALPSELRGMLLSEVDVMSASLVAIAYACFLAEQTLIAGLVFGLSVLVTPLSGPLVVVFVLTVSVARGAVAHSAKRHAARILKFGIAALAVYAPPVLFNYQDYMYGGRGLLRAPRVALTWSGRLAHSAAFIWHEAGFLIVLYAFGVAACLASARLWRTGQPALALMVSVGLMALVGQRFLDVPVQLPNLVLLATLPPVALASSAWAMRIGSLVVLGVGLLLARSSFATVRAEIAAGERSRALCVGIREQSRPRAAVLVGLSGWSRSKTFERYATLDASHPASALTWQDFVRHERRWLESANEQQIWFFNRVNPRQLSALLDAYALVRRNAGGRAFQVLVPQAK